MTRRDTLTAAVPLPVGGGATYEPNTAERRLLDRLCRSPADHEAMSAVHVLARISFSRVADAVDGDGIDFDALLDVPWSSGERVLVGVAAALWAGNERLPVADIVRSLDDHNLVVVLKGIALRRGWSISVGDVSA